MSVTLADVDLKFLRDNRWNIKVQLLSFVSTVSFRYIWIRLLNMEYLIFILRHSNTEDVVLYINYLFARDE